MKSTNYQDLLLNEKGIVAGKAKSRVEVLSTWNGAEHGVKRACAGYLAYPFEKNAVPKLLTLIIFGKRPDFSNGYAR